MPRFRHRALAGRGTREEAHAALARALTGAGGG